MPDPGKSEQKRSRGRGFVIIFLVLAASIMLTLGGLLTFAPQALTGKPSTTMKDLQDDYLYHGPTITILGEQKLVGNFRSFQANDNILFRDRVTRVEMTGHVYSGGTVTNLVFEAYPWPSTSTFEYDEKARAGNMTWYVEYFYPEESKYSAETNFPMNGQDTPEAIIGVDGDLSNRIHANDTVEIPFHVYNIYSVFPESTIVDENILEFKFLVSGDKVQVVTGPIQFSYALFEGIPLMVGGVIYVILAASLGIKRKMNVGRLGGITATVLSCILGIILPNLLGKFGGWWLTSFIDSGGKILSRTFGEWWLQGFAFFSGLAIAILTSLRVQTLDKTFWKKIAHAAITVTVGILITFIAGALVIFLPFSFLSITIPPFVLDNIISIGLAAAGIVIPFIIGIFVVALTPKTVDGIVTEARSSPAKLIVTVLMVVGLGSMIVGTSVGGYLWGATTALYLYVFGFVFTICLSIILFLWHRRSRAKKTTEQSSGTP